MSRLNKNVRICIIDDDEPLNEMIAAFLKKKGYTNVHSRFSGEDGLRFIEHDAAEIVIQDFDLPGMNGVEVLKKVKNQNEKIEFIMLSGQTEMKVAIDALTAGAFDYIIKDSFAKENVKHKIEKLLKIQRLIEEKRSLKIVVGVVLGLMLASWLAIIMLLNR